MCVYKKYYVQMSRFHLLKTLTAFTLNSTAIMIQVFIYYFHELSKYCTSCKYTFLIISAGVRYVLDIANTLNEDAFRRCIAPPPTLHPASGGMDSICSVLGAACKVRWFIYAFMYIVYIHIYTFINYIDALLLPFLG